MDQDYGFSILVQYLTRQWLCLDDYLDLREVLVVTRL